jgi:methionyl-tRNA formyltransferase
MRIIFMGTPEFACPTLNALVESGFEIIGVFTQADRPKGRGRIVQPPPVKELAQSLNLPVFQPAKLDRRQMGDLWSELGPEMVIVVAYGFILPLWILQGAPLGCINLHASLLPCYRGAAPINWSIIKGEKETGVTTMRMDEGMDTGPILLQVKTPIKFEDTSGSLQERLSLLGAELMIKTIRELTEGLIRPKAQPVEGSSLAPKLDKEIGRLDWHKDNMSLYNLIRGLNPFPGAFSFLDGRMIKIWFAVPVEEDAKHSEPGMICDLDAKLGLIVQTGKGKLALQEIQPENKKRMTVQSFISGYRSGPIGRIFRRFPD